jgi:hypothetical protein
VKEVTAMTTPHVPGDLFARAQSILGLRKLADYLENHPDLPVKEYGFDLTVYAEADTDAAGRAEIDRIADILGVTPVDNTPVGGHYIAVKTFGRIAYRAVFIPPRACERYNAENSYRGNIVPGQGELGQDEAAA